jgi:hypothetical protein
MERRLKPAGAGRADSNAGRDAESVADAERRIAGLDRAVKPKLALDAHIAAGANFGPLLI